MKKNLALFLSLSAVFCTLNFSVYACPQCENTDEYFACPQCENTDEYLACPQCENTALIQIA